MIVSEEFKFIYFAPKKTGSTSIRSALTKHYGAVIYQDYLLKHFKDTEVSPDWRSQGPDWKHVCHLHERFADYFKFSTVRNPYTLEQSRFLHDQRHKYLPEGTTFEMFVERLETANPIPTLSHKLHQNYDYVPMDDCVEFKLDAIVRLESFQDDFNKLPFYKDGILLEWLHKSSQPHPAYTRKACSIIKKCYKEDFRRFRYSRSCPSYEILI